jgi:hypothetical protein
MTPTWEHHVGAIALYVVVVILLAPTIIGLVLGLDPPPCRGPRFADLGPLRARRPRRTRRVGLNLPIFQRYGAGFILVHLKPGDEQRHSFIVGKFGRTSWAAQTPTTARDVYFEEVWPADADGQITEEFAVRRGVWLDSSQIDAMFFIDPPGAPPRFRHRAGEWLRGHRPHIRQAASLPPTEEPQSSE